MSRETPDGRIVVVDYNPKWPELFRREAEKIRAALGDVTLRLEHTGSTSVPGLVAKPVIDMTLVVADSADESAYVPALVSIGYVLRVREPDWHQHRMLKGRTLPAISTFLVRLSGDRSRPAVPGLAPKPSGRSRTLCPR